MWHSGDNWCLIEVTALKEHFHFIFRSVKHLWRKLNLKWNFNDLYFYFEEWLTWNIAFVFPIFACEKLYSDFKYLAWEKSVNLNIN